MADAKLEAALKLTPTRSQVFVVSLVVTGALSLGAGFIFLWAARGWVAAIPLAVGLGCICAACWAWSKSHRNIDMANAAPTTLRDAQSGFELSADARSLDAKDVRKIFAAGIQNLAHRIPLPEPDGLLGADGKPIPNSRQAAIARVQAANEEAARLESRAVEAIAQRRQDEDGAFAEQSAAQLVNLPIEPAQRTQQGVSE